MTPTVPLKLQILTDEGYKYLGFCKEKLAALGSLRRELKQYAMRKAYYLPDDLIAIVTSADVCDIITIIGGTPRGFLFHPRNGTILQTAYFGPYVSCAGWDFEGESLGEFQSLFPLVDDDHGTRLLKTTKHGGPWKFEMKPPENYGNIDWKGISEQGKKAKTPVLTWKGPVTRYWGAGTDVVPLSSKVYQSGEELFDLMGYDVYGAALTKDSEGNVWQIAVTHWGSSIRAYAQPYKSGDCANLYDEEDHPNGWRLLGQISTSALIHSPFLFNASGTEGSSCVEWQYVFEKGIPVLTAFYTVYTLNVNIDEKTAVFTKTAEDDNVETTATGNNTDPGSWDYDLHYYPDGEQIPDELCPTYDGYVIGTSGLDSDYNATRTTSMEVACIAADYDGDTKITASMTIQRSHYLRLDTEISNVFTSVEYEGMPIPWAVSSHIDSSTATLTETVKIRFNNTDYNLCSYEWSLKGSADEEYGGIQQGDGAPPVDHYYVESQTTHTLTETTSVIAFLDLRNSILARAEQKRERSRAYHHIYDHTLPADQQEPDEITTTDAYTSTKILITGETPADLNYFESAYCFNEQQSGTFKTDIGIASPSEIDNETIGFVKLMESYGTKWYQGGVNGSWAVDVFGNHFYSVIYDSGTYNYLTGCDDIATLTETPEPNQVYYPIAPL